MLDTAIAIVINSPDQILLIKRNDIPIWVLPGGGIDPGETPEIAVCRELLEETGLEGQIIRQIALYKSKNALSKNVYVFELAVTGGNMTSSRESREVAFFSLQQLPKPFFTLHCDWLLDAQKRLPSVIEKPLSATYWNALLYGLCNPILAYYFFRVKVFNLLRKWFPTKFSE